MSLVLTGPLDTSELPRIGVDPVTVTVSRDIAPGHEADFEAWSRDVQQALQEFPGCMGVGVLKAGATGGRYHIVFRFTDLVALRRWERSPDRTALLARLEEHVLATSVRRTVGVDHWFDLPAKVEPHRPWWRRWAGDVVVHVFHDDIRRFYDIERLYKDVPRVEWEPLTAARTTEHHA